jgi:iron(III) transport system ATP-binding protein
VTTTRVKKMNVIAQSTNNGREAGPSSNAYVTGLRKTFVAKGRTVNAVDGLDIQIAQGEYVVVLGPSGCGKSTLLRCIAGLEDPTEGSIGLRGHVVYDNDQKINVAPNKRSVGMVFQNYALWPHMTVEKNVQYPLRMDKVGKDERARRAADMLKALECDELGKRLPAELSGGQQQRVALARALVSEPGVLLLDEPLSNLDALLRVTLRAELLRLHRKLGFTALHITHDQEEALEMGDRVILMRQGRVEQMGPPEEVYARPVSPYAANFLGIRNQLDLTVGVDRLEYDGGVIDQSDSLTVGWSVGDKMQLFARSRDVHISEDGRDGGHFADNSIRLQGTLAQVVLGDGGRRQYVVDLCGRQWYVQHADTAHLSVGDPVTVRIARESLLLYHGDERVKTEVVG